MLERVEITKTWAGHEPGKVLEVDPARARTLVKEGLATRVPDLPGMPEKLAELLIENGYSSLDDLREASDEELQEIAGVGEKSVERIREVTHG